MVQAVKRSGLALVAVLALMVGATTQASATPSMPRPTVDVYFSWWFMQGEVKFSGDETRIMAEAGLVGAVTYATERIPNIWGKAAATAAGVVLWEVANQAMGSNECLTITFGLWDHRVLPAPC